MRYLFIILFAFGFACRNNSGIEYSASEEMSPMTLKAEFGERADISRSSQDESFSSSKKVIRTANIDIQVESIESAISRINKILLNFDAYISNENQYNNPGSKDVNFTIRVAERDLDSLMILCEKEAVFLRSKSVNSRDVTEEYIDISARIKTKRAVEERYLELLGKAKSLSEILDVEEKLRVIREEIESVEGRMNYLKSQINYSTLNLHLYQVVDIIDQEPGRTFLSRLKESLINGWSGFKKFILFVFYLWPFFLLTPFVILIYRRIRKKRVTSK